MTFWSSRKIKFISKFLMSPTGKQAIAIHILPNFSRSKDNQAMKFSQLIEFNVKNIFLEKSCTKCGGETIPKPLLRISLDYSLFLLRRSCRPLAFTSYKAFLRNKRRSGTSLPVSFSAWLLKKNVFDIIFY